MTKKIITDKQMLLNITRFQLFEAIDIYMNIRGVKGLRINRKHFEDGTGQTTLDESVTKQRKKKKAPHE